MLHTRWSALSRTQARLATIVRIHTPANTDSTMLLVRR